MGIQENQETSHALQLKVAFTHCKWDCKIKLWWNGAWTFQILNYPHVKCFRESLQSIVNTEGYYKVWIWLTKHIHRLNYSTEISSNVESLWILATPPCQCIRRLTRYKNQQMITYINVSNGYLYQELKQISFLKHLAWTSSFKEYQRTILYILQNTRTFL